MVPDNLIELGTPDVGAFH